MKSLWVLAAILLLGTSAPADVAPSGSCCDQTSYCSGPECGASCVGVAACVNDAACQETSESPGCSSTPVCESCVCDVDPYCCEVEWDHLCVQQARCECSASCSSAAHDYPYCDGPTYASATCDPVEGCVTETPVCCGGLRPGKCVRNESISSSMSEPSDNCQVPCLSSDDCVDGWCDVWGEICSQVGPSTALPQQHICFDTIHPSKCAMLGGYATQGSSCDPNTGRCVDPNDPPVCCVFPSPQHALPTSCENVTQFECVQYYGGEPVANAICTESGCQPMPTPGPAPFCCSCTGVGPFPNVCFEAMGPEQCASAGCEPVAGGVCDPVTERCIVDDPTPTLTPSPSPSATKTPSNTKTATITPTPTPVSVCGNGEVEPGEQCDPGAPVSGDCCDDECQFAPAETACDADDEPCTNDSCNATGVCVAGITSPDDTPCDDGNACTEGDACSDGVCSGTSIDCDDGFDCTIDSCNPEVGCLHIATIESRDCPGSCYDGINNDPLDPNDPLHDPNNPENDNDVDFEDSGCASLGPLARFGIIGTRDRMHRDLKLGSNTTVGSTRANGTCEAGTCACPVVECEPAIICTANSDCSSGSCNTSTNKCECTVNCPVAGNPCLGDSACLFEVDGTCDGGSGLCDCPDYAPNCQPLNRPCSSDDGCRAAPYPSGASFGGVCGKGMQITAGTHMGLLASTTTIRKLMFGTAESGDGLRTLDIEREFANAGGPRQLSNPAPFVGPSVCSDAPSQVCRVDGDCPSGTCTGRRRLADGSPFETFDGVPGAGLAGAGTSENFKRCDHAIHLVRSLGANSPSIIQSAIQAYAPSPAETVLLGPGNCLLCPSLTSLDGACTPCNLGSINVRTRANTKKVVLTVGSGLQVLDLRRLTLAGKTMLVIRGEVDTELLVRVDRSLRNGTGAKMLLEGMTSDQVLFVATGRFGGRPRVSGASTWRGSILATERRSGIMLGAQSYMEGGIYGQRILIKGPNSTVQHMPWKGKLASVP